MKNIDLRFEQDETLSDIEIIIRASERDAEVAALMERFSSADALPVADGDTLEMVPISDIVLLSVNDKTVSIITEHRKYTSGQPLTAIEAMLPSSRFVRISRYEIVNLTKVVRYDFTLRGTLRIELAGGMETWASRRCIPQIRRLLEGRK